MNINYGKNDHNTARRTLAEKLVLYCGVPANLCGFDKLTDCSVVASYRPNATRNEIYREVAAMYGIVPKSVLRAITYSINKTPMFAAAFAEVIGVSVREQDVHCGMVIAHFGKIIDKPELSPLYDPATCTLRFKTIHNA